MQIIRNILFFASLAIMLLHHFTPHQHHNEMDEETHLQTHQQANSLLDNLALVFHLSPESNHFSNILPKSGKQLTTKKVTQAQILDFTPNLAVPQSALAQNQPFGISQSQKAKSKPSDSTRQFLRPPPFSVFS